MNERTIGVALETDSGPGVLHQLTGVISRHHGDITSVEILETRRPDVSRLYLEIDVPGAADALAAELRAVPVVRRLELVQTFQRIYGKRIIIIGGGGPGGPEGIGGLSGAGRPNNPRGHHSPGTIPPRGEAAPPE